MKSMKKITAFVLSAVLLISISVPAFAQIPEEPQKALVEDNADLLSDSEEAALLNKLNKITEKHKCTVAVVTVDSLGGQSARAFADDYYDYNGYGYGISDDGILFLISINDRKWAMTTYGKAIRAFTDAGLDYIEEQFMDDLSDGEYADAFNTFADECDDFLTQYASGKPYDSNNMPKEPIPFLFITIVSVGAGIIIALIGTGIMKGKLKTVRSQPAAKSYIVNGSLNVTTANDLYLYRTVNRTRRESSSSSHGGGSSTHHSSSGRSHGGSSGSF